MGGAGGHMWHPFDCPDVNSGQDLIDFFKKCISSVRENPPALKIDGVNLSFRLREAPSFSPPFEFVVDRGSMKDLDVQGVTADNADQRFISKDPNQPHGMVEATRILLRIFNDSLPEIMPELEQLQMTTQSDHFGLYFNTEFVLKKINVKEYPFDFIAIHGMKKFEPKGPRSRQGIDVQVDKQVLERVRDKVEKFANEQDFKVFTSIPTQLKRNVNLDNVLNEDFTIVYSTQMRDEEEFEEGELGIGEGSTKPLKVWLSEVSENPIEKVINISDSMIGEYPKMGKKQTPYAKNIYLEVLKGTPVNEIAESINDVEAIVDGVVIMHATRILGNAVLDGLESDDFGPASDQEGVVINDPDICGGTSFKLTGNFILGGLATSFRESKLRSGRLLKEFNYADTQKTKGGSRYVILIPGGFKPPTVGHYNMIKQYDKNPEVVKVFIVVGFKPRGGVTHEQSMKIFDVYGGFSDKVEFKNADGWPTPMRACYEFMKDSEFTGQYPNESWSLGASDKEGDSKRIYEFEKYFNDSPDLIDIKIISHPPAEAYDVGGRPASASRMRQAVIDKNWKEFKSLLPNENAYNDVLNILDIDDEDWQYNQKQERKLDENFLSMTSLFSLVDEVLLEKKVSGVAPGLPIEAGAAEQYVDIKEEQLSDMEESGLRGTINTLLMNLKSQVGALVPDAEGWIDELANTLIQTVAEKEVEKKKEQEKEAEEKRKEQESAIEREPQPGALEIEPEPEEVPEPGPTEPAMAAAAPEESPVEELAETSGVAAVEGSPGGGGGPWGKLEKRDYYV